MKGESSVNVSVRRSRPGGRSERVVRVSLVAALEVFAERGYAGLSFEEVAARARVNKTTLYRRWPTKGELLKAALHHVKNEDPPAPDLGSLREDVGAILRWRVAKLSTPQGRSLARAVLLGASDPELSAVLAELRRERPAIARSVFTRAIARGELPAGTDTILLTETLVGAVHSRLFWRAEALDDAHLERIIDLIVAGAAAGAALKRRR